VVERVVNTALRHRWIVLTLAVLLALYGGYRLSAAQYDVFPSFAPPNVVIRTEAPGLAPKQVEQLITTPIERAVNGVSGIQSLRSHSVPGVSSITVAFKRGTNVYRDRQEVSQRLASVTGQLPGSAKPALSPLTSSTGRLLMVGLTSQKRSLMHVDTVARWTVRRALLADKGVANVVIYSGATRQLQIQIEPDKLVQYGLSINDVVNAAHKATGVRGAGFIDTGNQRVQLRTRGQSLTPKALAGVTVTTRHGMPITLGDIAHVKAAPAPAVGGALVNGHRGVVLNVTGQYGANTLQVTQRLEHTLHTLAPTLKADHIQLEPALFRPANFINRAVGNLSNALGIGMILVAAVLFLFLFNWRTALISLLAIPLSLLTGTLVLDQLGFTLNTMTLGGLGISVGLLVDDAVITVENIYRRLRENQRLTRPRPVLSVIRDATLEVRSAVVYATLAIAMVFIPVLTMPGVAGHLFGPLADAYILATLASLGVALTLTPVLCYWLLGQRQLEDNEPPVMAWLKPRYGTLLGAVERHYRIAIVVVVLITGAGLSSLPFFGARFIPNMKEGHYIVHMVLTAGTSLKQSFDLGRTVSHALSQLPYVRSVAQTAGRTRFSDETHGTNSSEFDVDLKSLSGAQSNAARRAIQQTLAGIPGANFAVNTVLAERMEETISGQTAPVVIHVFGSQSLDKLNHQAHKIAGILRHIPGAQGVRLEAQPNSPQLGVNLSSSALSRWGFHPLSVLNALRTAYHGDTVGQVYDGDRIFNVSVILPPKDRNSISDVGKLMLRSPNGVDVPLRSLGRIHEDSGLHTILHEGGRRVATVTAQVAGRSTSAFMAQARKRISQQLQLPSDMYVQYSGTAQAQSRSTQQLLLSALIAGVFVILMLSLALARPRNLALILFNLPFALVGGVASVALFLGSTLSMGATVGFVTVFGITLRNSIMMIAHYEHLVYVEGLPWGIETAIRGAQERLAPILMTALVTAFGLLPLALAVNAPGNAIEGPMALVILGGVFTSTILNLLILPALSLRYGRFEGSKF